jgi:membrane protease YdiL (CAAX protease family)
VPPSSQPWQRHPLTQLLAVLVGVAPLYGLAIMNGLQSMITGETQQFSVGSSLFGATLYVSAFGAWVLALLYFVCGSSLAELQLKPNTLLRDILHGILYSFLLLLAMAMFHLLTAEQGSTEVPPALRAIADALAGDRLLFIIWIGPVIWLQAAVLEELYRAFMLSRLWIVWPSKLGRILVIIGSSLLFGLGHLYEGPLGVAGTALIGALLSYYYLRHGRVLPMIIAHGLYNTVVLCGLVLLSKSGLL